MLVFPYIREAELSVESDKIFDVIIDLLLENVTKISLMQILLNLKFYNIKNTFLKREKQD